MKLILALLALAALPFEIYQALHHLYDAPIAQSWAHWIGIFLTLAVCGFGIADLWHHFRHVREHDSRNKLSVVLIITGVFPVLVSPVVFYVAAIHFRVLLIWPLWAGAAGITAIALGALTCFGVVLPGGAIYQRADKFS